MSDVRHILHGKPSEVCTTGPTATVFAALQLMADKNIGAVIVMDGAQVVGVFSERDYARKVVLHGRASKTTPVGELMTPAVYYVTPAHSVEQCMALMTNKHIRHLPVLDNGKLIGVVSIGDLVKAMLDDQKFQIDQLEQYITGRHM